MSAQEITVIVETGTLNAIVETGTLTAIQVDETTQAWHEGIADLRGITDKKKRKSLDFTIKATAKVMRPQAFSILGKLARTSKTESYAKVIRNASFTTKSTVYKEHRLTATAPFDGSNVRTPLGYPTYVHEEVMKKIIRERERERRMKSFREAYKRYKEEFDS
jgi:hypothetical protein